MMVRPTLILVTIVALANAAHGDGQEAKKHYERGTKAFNLQDFRGALHEFQAAYAETPDPVFLFNIAQAQRQLGQYEAAARSYRAFLVQSPDAPNRATAEDFAKQMDGAARAARQNARFEPRVAPQSTSSTTAPSVTTPLPTEQVSASTNRKWHASSIGWSLVGGGALLLGISGGLLGVAMSERDAALSATTQTRFDMHHNRSTTLQQVGWPLLVVGAAAVAGGGIVLVGRARSTHR